MQNLNPTRVIARRGRDAMIVGALLLMGGLVVAILGVLIALLFSSTLLMIVLLGIGGLIVLVGFGFLVRGLTYRMENDLARTVAETLGRELDARYTLIRNVSRGGLGYIDAVLLGPPGALVFRIVDSEGIFQNEGSDWLERKGGQNFTLSRLNPTRECVTDVYALRKYLSKRSLATVPVYGIVVFVNPNAQITARQPIIPISELRTMTTVMRREYMSMDRIDAETVKKAIDILYN
jgi:hypothetical protein